MNAYTNVMSRINQGGNDNLVEAANDAAINRLQQKKKKNHMMVTMKPMNKWEKSLEMGWSCSRSKHTELDRSTLTVYSR